MEDRLKQILQQVRTLTPAADFVSRSKATILIAPQKIRGVLGLGSRFFESMKFSTALTLSALFLFVALSGFSYIRSMQNPSLASSTALLQEASDLNFQIQIKEATYFSQTAQQVALALDEISKGNEPGARRTLAPIH